MLEESSVRFIMDTKLLSLTSKYKKAFGYEGGLVIEPAAITFQSVTPGQLYSTTFLLRNTTRTAQSGFESEDEEVAPEVYCVESNYVAVLLWVGIVVVVKG